jgi:hypothetical protein
VTSLRLGVSLVAACFALQYKTLSSRSGQNQVNIDSEFGSRLNIEGIAASCSPELERLTRTWYEP